ncbi:hypothetical protein ASF48_04860 [Rathayibacter sp. Leaf299]|uniref:acyltransferase family protein n=1 Tax=Rathayibacter sp. Leaf299 TaxID=1736328 RepID=UPI0006F349BB|nr:acyltransferase [Rathayibacter sp. Leaf299]KQQ22516.1 hypothetical protein ASF48_04860 [Rathayibacter sp. Leaf299]
MSGNQTASKRIPWIDAARGGCVLAVVMFHFIIVIFEPAAPAGPVTTGWSLFGAALAAFRMPLLFAVSGFVVARRVRAGRGDRSNAARVASSYYLYVVWLVAYGLISLIPLAVNTDRITSPGDFLGQLLIPDTPLWFILALAVYTAVLCSLPRARPAYVLAMLAVLSITAQAVLGFELWARVPYYFLFFAAGVYLRPLIEQQAGRATPLRTVVSGGVFTVFFVLEQVVEVPLANAVLFVARDAAALSAGLLAVVLLCRVAPVRRVLSRVGRSTLPIYVLHFPLVMVAASFIDWTTVLESPATAAAAPIVGPAVIAVLCLVIYRLALRTPLRFAFRMPGRWQRAISPTPAKA